MLRWTICIHPLVVFTCNFLHNVNSYSLGTPWLETTRNVDYNSTPFFSVSSSEVCSEMGVSACTGDSDSAVGFCYH